FRAFARPDGDASAGCKIFLLFEPDPKIIVCADVRRRVVHHRQEPLAGAFLTGEIAQSAGTISVARIRDVMLIAVVVDVRPIRNPAVAGMIVQNHEVWTVTQPAK